MRRTYPSDRGGPLPHAWAVGLAGCVGPRRRRTTISEAPDTAAPELTEAERRRGALATRTMIGLLATLATINAVVSTASPWFLDHHPLALVTIDSRNRFVFLTSPLIDDGVAMVALVTIRRLVFDPVFFAYGRAVRNGSAGYNATSARVVELVRRVLDGPGRWRTPLVYVLASLAPGAPGCVLAAASGMRTRVFVALDVVGTIVVVTAFRLLALEASGPLLSAGEWIADNGLVASLGLGSLAIAPGLVSRRRDRAIAAAAADSAT